MLNRIIQKILSTYFNSLHINPTSGSLEHFVYHTTLYIPDGVKVMFKYVLKYVFLNITFIQKCQMTLQLVRCAVTC